MYLLSCKSIKAISHKRFTQTKRFLIDGKGLLSIFAMGEKACYVMNGKVAPWSYSAKAYLNMKQLMHSLCRQYHIFIVLYT